MKTVYCTSVENTLLEPRMSRTFKWRCHVLTDRSIVEIPELDEFREPVAMIRWKRLFILSVKEKALVEESQDGTATEGSLSLATCKSPVSCVSRLLTHTPCCISLCVIHFPCGRREVLK